MTIVYFVPGYLLYASLCALLGVLAPSAHDASQFVSITIIPLVLPLLLPPLALPLLFPTAFGERPNGTLSTTLSLLLSKSPAARVARMTGTNRTADNRPGTETDEAKENIETTDTAGQPERSRIPKIRPIYSRQRVWMLGLVGGAMLILGIREYLRDDSSGIIIAVAGAFVAGSAYYWHRRHR